MHLESRENNDIGATCCSVQTEREWFVLAALRRFVNRVCPTQH